MSTQIPIGGITIDWLLGVVASNPTPAVIARAIETAYALGQRDCARESLRRVDSTAASHQPARDAA